MNLFSANVSTPELEGAGALALDALITILIGVSVVFLVLLLLTGVFKLFGIVMTKIEKRTPDLPMAPVAPKAPVAVPAAPAAPAAPIVGNTEPVSSKPDVDGGVPAETVAAISAAVASVAPEGTQYAVKGIKKL